MEKLNFESISHRIQASTPVFWKKVRRIGMAIGAVGLAINAAIATNTLVLPSWLSLEVVHSMVLVGVVVTALSSLTAEKSNG